MKAHLLKSSKLFLKDQKGGALFRKLLLQPYHIYIIFYNESVKKNTNCYMPAVLLTDSE